MRHNRRMRAHLDDLRSRQVDGAVDPGLAAARVPLELAEAQGLVLLRQESLGWRSRLTEFSDPTSLECTANKIALDELIEPRFVRSAPLLLLVGGILMAERLSRELQRFPGRFNVIVSYDGESCSVRFHRIRPGERWLQEDLEAYDEEGVLVFETGPGAAELRLL